MAHNSLRNITRLATASTRLRNRYLRHQIRRAVKRVRININIRSIRLSQRVALLARIFVVQIAKCSATVLALIIVLSLNIFAHVPVELKPSAMHLTSAAIIGGALALVLSLSVIPAQRAAEAFSPAILNLYARDRALLMVFLTLVGTTMLSVLLGTEWIESLNARYSVSLQFILLGISFDALRLFYVRVLDLLAPQTAVKLVLRECSKQMASVKRIVERLVRVLALAGGAADQQTVSRAALYAKSQIARSLRAWTAQLDEFAHKAIARRDTHGANEIVTAMGTIGQQYAEARRSSLILLPDWDNLFAGGVSDIGDVLNPIYESIRVICEDAAKAPNELIVRHCMQTLEVMTTRAMEMVHSQDGHWQTAPLAYSPCFYLGMCVQTAIRENMADAVLAAVNSFQTILVKKTADVDTRTVEAQALESLFTITAASYARPDSVWAFPAMNAMLFAARRDIQVRGYRDLPMLKTVLGYSVLLAPLEVAMDKAGKRRIQTFPPYSLGFEANVAMLLYMVAGQVEVDAERPWVNPFHEFLEASEDIADHYRNLARTDFLDTLLRKWVVDSLVRVMQVHLSLLSNPPAGAENHLDDIDNRMRWLIHTVPSLFPEGQNPFPSHHADDACGALAILGMNLLEMNRNRAAQDCGTAISAIAAHATTSNPEPYSFADLQQKLEILARAAAALGHAQAATEFRAMIQRPPSISDANWPHFVEARQTRIRQLDEHLEEIERHGMNMPDDPIPLLRRILARPRDRGG
jgi:hypothetical protein